MGSTCLQQISASPNLIEGGYDEKFYVCQTRLGGTKVHKDARLGPGDWQCLSAMPFESTSDNPVLVQADESSSNNSVVPMMTFDSNATEQVKVLAVSISSIEFLAMQMFDALEYSPPDRLDINMSSTGARHVDDMTWTISRKCHRSARS